MESTDEPQPPDTQQIARCILVAAQALELAQSRGAFKLGEASQVAEAVETLKSLVKVEQSQSEADRPLPERAAETPAAPKRPSRRTSSRKGKEPAT